MTNRKNSIKQVCGFTLVELLIVVVVIAILAAIAYPSYRNSVIRSQRTDARATLLEAAQIRERCYTEYNAYNDSNCILVNSSNVVPATTSDTAPLTGDGYYTISSTALTQSTYTLQAAPTSKGGQNTDATCGTYTLTQTGARTPTTTGCW